MFQPESLSCARRCGRSESCSQFNISPDDVCYEGEYRATGVNYIKQQNITLLTTPITEHITTKALLTTPITEHITTNRPTVPTVQSQTTAEPPNFCHVTAATFNFNAQSTGVLMAVGETQYK